MWIPLLAYGMSVLGSLIGLACMARARSEPKQESKILWTVLGAFAIGGVAIWLMHFIGMLGFDVTGTLKYSATLTALSALVSVAVVGVGLSMVTLIAVTTTRLVSAGVLAGLGVAAMHYMGMAAIVFQGELTYDPLLTALSCLIAVVAATVAFWFTLVVKTALASTAAGLLMGAAVTGMHYTGMAAVSVTTNLALPAPTGTEVFDLVFPVFVIGVLGIAVLLWMLFMSENDPLGDPTG
jgi:NO-binding membrane sensor protein with MHYT domain